MDSTQKAVKNQEVCEPLQGNLGITQSSGLDRHAVYAMTTSSFIQVEKNQSPVIMARDYKDPNVVCPAGEYAVRRLTPTECARLQGLCCVKCYAK